MRFQATSFALVALLCSSFVPRAHAQEPRGGEVVALPPAADREQVRNAAPSNVGTLGLREAILLASRTDPRVAVAAARRRAAEALRDEALVGYAPDLLVGAGYTDGFPGSGSNLGLRGMLGSPFFRHYVAGVDASWNVVELLRTPFAVRAANAKIDAADASAEVGRRSVALAVIDLFERVVTATESRAILDAEVQARREQMAAVLARVEAGTLAGEQLLQAEAGLADLEAELATASSDEGSMRAALRALVGHDRALTATLVIEVPEGADELPEVRIARAYRRQASDLAKLGDLMWIPKLTVGGSVGYANPPPGTEPGYYALGAAVAFPLTGGFRDASRARAEVATAEARALEVEGVVRELAVRLAEMDGAITGLETALPAAERSRNVAERALAAVTVRAEAGAVPQVDVEAARVVLRRAEVRARMLRLRIDSLRARRSFLTTASRS